LFEPENLPPIQNRLFLTRDNKEPASGKEGERFRWRGCRHQIEAVGRQPENTRLQEKNTHGRHPHLGNGMDAPRAKNYMLFTMGFDMDS